MQLERYWAKWTDGPSGGSKILVTAIWLANANLENASTVERVSYFIGSLH